ncbi:MAG: hypothetical protein WKG01_23690 [Kofleriaceae bacterium]
MTDASRAEQAEAWIAAAEGEPCFRWRSAPARDALEKAIVLMPIADRPDLDARAALRRAELELTDGETTTARTLADVATVICDRAGDRMRSLLARVISSRAALRDPDPAVSATAELATIASELASIEDEPGADKLIAIALAAQLAIGSAEQALGVLDLDGARGAYDHAETILREAPAAALADARFLALQGTALTAQTTRSFGRAADRLRTIVRLVRTHGSPRDELDARMALGHMLTLLGKHEDAVRHLDLARALAKAAAGVDEQLLATQSAALAAVHGKSYGRALDRAYEALKLAGLEKRDVASYLGVVSLIAQIHLAREAPSEAYLALVYGAAALKQRIGSTAGLMLEVQIEEMKKAMGPEKFETMCEQIIRAREARARLESR